MAKQTGSRGRGRPRKALEDCRSIPVDAYFQLWLFEKMQDYCKRKGGRSHSQFVTEAVAEKLEREANDNNAIRT